MKKDIIFYIIAVTVSALSTARSFEDSNICLSLLTVILYYLSMPESMIIYSLSSLLHATIILAEFCCLVSSILSLYSLNSYSSLLTPSLEASTATSPST